MTWSAFVCSLAGVFLVKLVTVGGTTSLILVSVTATPVLPSSSVKVTLSVMVPSPKPLKSTPVICWFASLTSADPVTSSPSPLLLKV